MGIGAEAEKKLSPNEKFRVVSSLSLYSLKSTKNYV